MIDVSDFRFLLRKENLVYQTIKQSNDESKSSQDLSSENRADDWYGIETWLRLHHCVLEEEALEVYISMHT